MGLPARYSAPCRVLSRFSGSPSMTIEEVKDEITDMGP